MKKAQFYTRIFSPVCQDRQEALKVNGYTFNHFDHEFGCYKDGCYGWYVVDLGSGLAIVGHYPTRKKVMEEFYDEDLQKNMLVEFVSSDYRKRVDIFNKMIEKAKESEGNNMGYKKRYEDEQRQYAYENACDCLQYGYGMTHWNSCGIEDKEERLKIWNKAFHDLAESEGK